MKGRSIQKRLMITVSVIITAALCASSLAIYNSVERSLYHQMDSQLQSEANILIVEVELEDGEVEHDWLVDLEYRPESRRNDYIQVWDVHSKESTKSPALEGGDLEMFSGDLNEMKFKTVGLPNGRQGRAMGVLVLPTVARGHSEGVSPADHPQILVLAHDLEWVLAPLKSLKYYLSLTAFFVNLVSLAAIYFVIRSSFKPIKQVTEAIEGIDVLRTDSELSVPSEMPLELMGMVAQYRDLLSRVNDARTRERRFTSNAAHELRTPIAGVMSTLEASLLKPRTTEQYVEAMERAAEITSGMKGIIDSVMMLARLEKFVESPEVAEIDTNTFLRAIVDSEMLSRADTLIEVEWIFKGSQKLSTSENYLGVVVRNIISNAFTYSIDGRVSICSEMGNGYYGLTVKNNSAPIDQEKFERLGESFYRADEGRLVDGHVGLGLSLCLEICRVLGAELVFSAPVEGEFIARLRIPQ